MKKIRQTLKVHISIITRLMIKLKFGMDEEFVMTNIQATKA